MREPVFFISSAVRLSEVSCSGLALISLSSLRLLEDVLDLLDHGSTVWQLGMCVGFLEASDALVEHGRQGIDDLPVMRKVLLNLVEVLGLFLEGEVGEEEVGCLQLLQLIVIHNDVAAARQGELRVDMLRKDRRMVAVLDFLDLDYITDVLHCSVVTLLLLWRGDADE